MKKINALTWKMVLVATGLLLLLLLFSHTYNDIVITTRHGMNFWDILFSGKILDFYSINITDSGNLHFPNVQSCAYNILVYIVFAIWNIPLVLLEKFAGIDVMNNMFCLAYSKCLVVVAILLSAYLVEQILELLDVTKKNRKFTLYLYLTSTLMVSVGLITSQYDILSVIFQLLGLKAYLQNKDRLFVLWFGIAVCFKYFALIMFLPLLVLRYKKVFVWIVATAAVCIPTVITKIPFMFSTASSLPETNLMLTLLQMLLGYSRKELNLFVIAYIFCIVWCFFQNDQSDTLEYRKKAIWCAFVAYAVFFCFLSAYPYWVILMAPYIVMVLALAPKRIYANLLLETFGMAALVFASMLKYRWCYLGRTMRSMLIPHLFGPEESTNAVIYNLIVGMNDANFFPVFNAVFIACMGAIAYLTYPKSNSCKQENGLLCDQCMDVVVVRWLVTTVICLLPILSYFI